MVAYDNGFVTEVGVSQLHIWDKQLAVGVEMGLEAKKTLSPSHAGSKSYMDEIEKVHPGYLRELFCHAQKVKGVKATFAELADAANQQLEAPG
jgi:hypothetical protein